MIDNTAKDADINRIREIEALLTDEQRKTIMGVMAKSKKDKYTNVTVRVFKGRVFIENFLRNKLNN
ncbi:MAG: hypothetical protein KBT34_05640 [Prevotella sp.]|nr:hypothetical protein [Candidatus Prevotella equi]